MPADHIIIASDDDPDHPYPTVENSHEQNPIFNRLIELLTATSPFSKQEAWLLAGNMYWLHKSTLFGMEWELGKPGEMMFIMGRNAETGCQRIALVELGLGDYDSQPKTKESGRLGKEPGHAAAWDAFREMIDERVMDYIPEIHHT